MTGPCGSCATYRLHRAFLTIPTLLDQIGGMLRRSRRKKLAKTALRVDVPASSNGAPSEAGTVRCADSMVKVAEGTAPLPVVMSPEQYASERALLADLEKANTDQHDKAVLQLTAATLAISATFIEKIVRIPAPNTLWILGWGWIALTISMVLMILSFWTGRKACRKYQAWLDRAVSVGVGEPEQNRWSTATDSLSGLSCLLFIAGIILILSFSWLNIPSPQAGQAQGGVMNAAPQAASEPHPKPDTGHPAPRPPAMPRPAPPIKK